eukprot:TRINITY_DN7869_c0_g1_i1.p2 TRINITY_DN7869_c0_g1~~TRINITY_DN7869_c0_g1_i1.p2  ORF type:complete len:213 (-),score=41.25 TRINITY_DN7869_c0_g1_i1:319-957(-)
MLSVVENNSQFSISVDGKVLPVSTEKECFEDRRMDTDSSFINWSGEGSGTSSGQEHLRYGGGLGEQPTDDLCVKGGNPYEASLAEAPAEDSSWSDAAVLEHKSSKRNEERPAIFAKQIAENKKLQEQRKAAPKIEPKTEPKPLPLIDFDDFDLHMPAPVENSQNVAPNPVLPRERLEAPLVPVSKPIVPCTNENAQPPKLPANSPCISFVIG